MRRCQVWHVSLVVPLCCTAFAKYAFGCHLPISVWDAPLSECSLMLAFDGLAPMPELVHPNWGLGMLQLFEPISIFVVGEGIPSVGGGGWRREAPLDGAGKPYPQRVDGGGTGWW